MTDDVATDAESFVVAWLTPFFNGLSGGVGRKRQAGDPLPFGIVHEVDNLEYEQQIASLPLVSVHWLAATEADCIEVSTAGHRHMSTLLLDPTTQVDVDGQVAVLEWFETAHGPTWVEFTSTNQVFRKVSRYKMSLGFQEAADGS